MLTAPQRVEQIIEMMRLRLGVVPPLQSLKTEDQPISRTSGTKQIAASPFFRVNVHPIGMVDLTVGNKVQVKRGVALPLLPLFRVWPVYAAEDPIDPRQCTQMCIAFWVHAKMPSFTSGTVAKRNR